MRKLAIIYRVDTANAQHRAVRSMQQGNADAWQLLGYNVCQYYLKNGIWHENEISLGINGHGIWNQLFYLSTLINIIKIKSFDLIIIMHTAMSYGLKDFCQRLRLINPSIKIILELQTYPYVYEYSYPKRWIAQILMPSNLKRRIDAITHLGPEKSIWQVPTIQAINAIDTSTIPTKTHHHFNNKELKALVVCNFWPWHNYEQLIHALHAYQNTNPTVNIKLTFVGDGPFLPVIVQLIADLKLEEYIDILPRREESKMIDLVNQHHLGIGNIAVGLQRKGYCQSLKHRFYAASGLPFVLNTKDPFFFDKAFCCFIDQTDVNVSFLQQMVSWYIFNQHKMPTFTIDLRQWTDSQLSWTNNVKNIESAIFCANKN